MRMRIFKLLMLLCAISCTKDNFINTGVSNGRHDCSLLEYMKRHPYDWDSTVIMVRHAGLEALFEKSEWNGKHYDGITFFGVTNHSIRRYLLQNSLNRVTDMKPEVCREVLLRCIVEGKIYRDDVPRGKKGGSYNVIGEGGESFTTLGGTTLWVYSFAEDYQGVPNLGSVTLYGAILDSRKAFEVASADIEPNNCVVHALEYKITISDFLKPGESLK